MVPQATGDPLGPRCRRIDWYRLLFPWGWLVRATALIAVLQGARGTVAAQEPAAGDSVDRDRDYAWVGAGLGVGSEDFAGSANFSYQHGVHLLSLRVAGTTGLFEEGFADVALLYGRSTRPRHSPYRAALGLGVGLAHGCAGGAVFSSCVNQTTVVGLPLEAHLTWLPFESFGVGLYGFANFNRIRNIAGVTLGIQAGSVR